MEIGKGGACWIEISLHRGRDYKGLEIFVKADPKIESFFAAQSQAPAIDIRSFGENWSPIDPSPLLIYRIANDTIGDCYRFDNVGAPFTLPSARDPKANLSFLKFIGISSPTGITFGVNNPSSKPFVKELANSISVASKAFLRDHIVPFHISLRVSSQEL